MENGFEKAKKIRDIGLNAVKASSFNMPFYDEETERYRYVLDKKYQFKAILKEKYISEVYTSTKFGGFLKDKEHYLFEDIRFNLIDSHVIADECLIIGSKRLDKLNLQVGDTIVFTAEYSTGRHDYVNNCYIDYGKQFLRKISGIYRV